MTCKHKHRGGIKVKVKDIVTVQPRTLAIGTAQLAQDDKLRILEIHNSIIVFEELKTGEVHEVSRVGLEFAVE